jgi:hypothetical protein
MHKATAMNASSVPALARATIWSSGIRPANMPTMTAVIQVMRIGVPVRTLIVAPPGQQSVTRHHKEDMALAEQKRQDHGRQGNDGRGPDAIISGRSFFRRERGDGQPLSSRPNPRAPATSAAFKKKKLTGLEGDRPFLIRVQKPFTGPG